MGLLMSTSFSISRLLNVLHNAGLWPSAWQRLGKRSRWYRSNQHTTAEPPSGNDSPLATQFAANIVVLPAPCHDRGPQSAARGISRFSPPPSAPPLATSPRQSRASEGARRHAWRSGSQHQLRNRMYNSGASGGAGRYHTAVTPLLLNVLALFNRGGGNALETRASSPGNRRLDCGGGFGSRTVATLSTTWREALPVMAAPRGTPD